MGWTFSSEWESKEDVLSHYESMIERAGYKVFTSGNWLYAEKDGKPVDLIYVITRKDGRSWGYKEISVSGGPGHYNAPLWMVLKVYCIFEKYEYFIDWLERYPMKNQVLSKLQEAKSRSLFEEMV